MNAAASKSLLNLRLLAVLLLLAIPTAPLAQTAIPGRQRPKLVVVLVVDQMRADYLERFAPYETGGFHYLVSHGANFLNANYQHLPTETCVGHTVISSGRNPDHTGIVANNWYDRDSAKMVYCVDDAASAIVGGKGAPVSPKKLVGDNFSDWFQASFPGSRVYSLSLKDRAAILMGGHHPQGAFWFSPETGTFVTSTFYVPQLPAWVADFNAHDIPDSYAGKDWTQTLDPNSSAYTTHEVKGSFPHHMPDKPGAQLYNAVYGSPFGDETLEALAETAVTANNLGGSPPQAATPDLLEISFSSNDPVGHAFGPDSPEIADEQIRLDRTLGKFVDFLNQRLGADSILWVLSADHGAEPTPEAEQELDHKAQAQRIPPERALDSIQQQLNTIFQVTGDMHWFAAEADCMLYFDRAELTRHRIPLADARQALAHKVHDVPGILSFYDTGDLENLTGWAGQFVRNSDYPSRSGDVYYLTKEWDLVGTFTSGTSHSDPWPYDTHVPLVFAGWGIRANQISAPVHLTDLTPTLAALLGVNPSPKEIVDGKSLRPLLQKMATNGATP